jgi:hypothetical protein
MSVAGKEYIQAAKQEIAAWETGQRGFLGRLSDVTLDPAIKLTSKVIPDALKEAASQLIEESLQVAVQASHFTTDSEAVVKERAKAIGKKKNLAAVLKVCDEIAKQKWTNHCGLAAAGGAATGIAGAPGVLADIPLIISIAIREIKTISCCYGYEPIEPGETEYLLNVLRIGSATDPAMRAHVLRLLKELEGEQVRSIPRIKHLVSLKEYAQGLALGILRRKALQVVPLAGMVTGASFNALYANDIGRAAYMCYRRRFIHQKVQAFPNHQP